MFNSSRPSGSVSGSYTVASEKSLFLRSLFDLCRKPAIIRLIATGIIFTVVGAVAIGLVVFPTMPDGLEIPNPPSLSQRLQNGASKLLSHLETKAEAAPSPIPGSHPAGVPTFDFDGMGSADYSVWHASSTQFKVKPGPTASPTPYTIGSGASVPAPGDFNGDGTDDVAVFSAGQWSIKLSGGGTSTPSFGQAGDVPRVADYDGDGKADLAVWRPSTGKWWWVASSDSNPSTNVHDYQFGALGDIPVVGNFDGDSHADFAVFRQTTGYWYIQQSTAGYMAIHWGSPGDIPVAGDYDGDGKTDPAVFRGSSGYWYSLKSTDNYGPNIISYAWGTYGDEPVPADYDGDGITDMAVWRATTGDFWITKSSGGSPPYYSVNLGISGDFAVPSAYLKQIGGHVTGYDVAPLRLSPKQATGGTNYYSQNFGWGRTLVSLPGRAGLDAAFGISYNSLIWLKDTDNATIYFDPDAGNVGPGFRFGFPIIEQAYYDSGKSTFCYIMVTPDGGRREFRQTAVSYVYEAADSSYAQIIAPDTSTPNTLVESLPLIVTTTDGTQMTYEWKGTAFHCKEVKDRNGNFITIDNDANGLMTKVTDTLGREINIDYDADNFPESITQDWKDENGHGSVVSHNWASFTYATKTLALSFDGLTVVGPSGGATLKVLQKITYADGSYTKFTYNTFGQVYKVQNYADNDDELNHEWHNIDSPGTDLLECPKFTQTKIFAKDFNGDSEVLLKNTAPEATPIPLPEGTPISGNFVDLKGPNATATPDAMVTRIYSLSSGWSEGVPVLTEDYNTESSTLTLKRWHWTKYTQDNESLSYILNPRVKETQIGDGAHIKKTTIKYYEPTTDVFPYGLPEEVSVGDASTVLKTQKTIYSLTNYTGKRIIGLPSETRLYQGTTDSGTLMSKVTFGYDESGYGGTGQSVTASKHDGDYGTSFTYRGNRTTTKRWDIDHPTDDGYTVSSSVKYNILGAPISQTDPRGRVSTISYTDNFNSTVSPATYAYPTTVTDPGGFSSTIQYRFDNGSNIWARSPVPYASSGNTYGKTTSRTFDDTTGRISKEKNENTGAYTRYSFGNDGKSFTTYTTLFDSNSDTYINSGDEVETSAVFDGAGRMLKTRTVDLGNTGGYVGKKVIYNILGQAMSESVPTEINSSWNPAGDDYRGMSGGNYIWLWNKKEYDWKGRVTRVIPSDSTESDNKDTLISYDGCGCAGSQVTTVQGPQVPKDDGSGNARRIQKIYEDPLGRMVQAERYNWNGTTVYSTVVNTYNARDQITNVRQYAGNTSSSFQDTISTFDGHGRLKTTHRPEQIDGSDDPTYTSYNYNEDDTVKDITDGRGAVTHLKYGHVDDSGSSEYRTLLTKKTYTVPYGSSIPVPSNAFTFTYDNAGNRTAMTDDLGSVAYEYNELSRMTKETRLFSDSLTDAPLIGGVQKFRISYTYNASGGLTSYTDPYGDEIDYSLDKTGRLTAVTGSSFGGETGYLSSPTYRAWGAAKHLHYGNGYNEDLTYNDRLQPATYVLDNPSDSDPTLFSKEYEYYPDGKLKLSDEVSGTDRDKFDRLFTYDFAERLKDAKTGVEAHGSTETDLTKLPYRQTHGYDAFDHLTSRASTLWDATGDWGFSYTFTNNRSSDGAFDADGRQTMAGSSDIYYEFDATGALTKTWNNYRYETLLGRDGDGREARRSNSTWTTIEDDSGSWNSPKVSYFIYSNVLGQNVTEVGHTGKKERTFVIAGGKTVARQVLNSGVESVQWEHHDATGLDGRLTFPTGGSSVTAYEALDGMGNNMGTHPPITSLLTNRDSGHDRGPIMETSEPYRFIDGIMMPAAIRFSPDTLDYEFPYVDKDGKLQTYHSTDRDRVNLPGRIVGFYLPDIRQVINHGQEEGGAFGRLWLVDQRALTNDEIGNLRSALTNSIDKKTASGKKCADFLAATLKEMGRSVSLSVTELFEKIAKQSGGFVVDPDYDYAETYTTVDGKPPIVRFGKGFANDDYTTSQLIHELFHAAGRKGADRYDHFDMAQAAYAVAQRSDAEAIKDLKKPTFAMTNADRISNNNVSDSVTFGTILNRMCFPSIKK